MRSLMMMKVCFLAAALGAVGCAGVEAEGPEVAYSTQSLALLPDCAQVMVRAGYAADATSADDVYNVRQGATPVCTTSFDGLQALAMRVDATDPVDRSRGRDKAGSDPMPGRGSNPAASDPMPGRDSNPGASDPMPGRGSNPAASDPMPGRGSAESNTTSTLEQEKVAAHVYSTTQVN